MRLLRAPRALRFLLPLLTAVAACFVLAACGDGSSPTDESSTDEAPSGASSAPAPAASDSSAAGAAAGSGRKVNLNTATSEEFGALPGVGERMVHEFEEYRPYISIQQFRREIGKYVDEDQVAAYEQHVYVPIQYNQSDGPTLQQIPGLSVDGAQELMNGRPYTSSSAFLEAVATQVSPQARATAETYLADGTGS